MDLSIVVPCYNEEGSLPLLFDAVDNAFADSGVSYELILVNDGSSDATSRLLHELPAPASTERIVTVDFSRNFGKESALLAGLQHAEGDAVGLMDADLQQPPTTLLEMYRMLLTNPSVDCVAAFQEHRKEGAVLRFFKEAFYKTFDATSKLNAMPDASDFRVFRRSVADALLSMPESFRFSKGMFAWVGFETLPFPYTPAERVQGETKWSFRKLMRYGIGGVLSFTTFPLKIAAVTGGIATLAGLALLIEVIVEQFINPAMPSGYPTLLCVQLILGGLILSTLGVIGEYIARIYIETKRRPAYIAKSVEVRTPEDKPERDQELQ